jgi:hypothetical protein
MKSSFAALWLMSWIVFFANRIPLISKIVTLLTFYFGTGKSGRTIIKIIVKLRKGFVIFNAIIGMYLVYKTTGFSYDNVLAGFAGLGHTYLEMFVSFNKRLFNWLLELFDYKIIPNVPSNPTKPTGPIWNPNPFNKGWEDKGIDLTKFSSDWFKNPFKITVEVTPWYKDLSSWLWIGGIICTIGVSYAGYKWMTEPSFLEGILSYFKSNPTIQNTAATPPTNGGDGAIALNDLRTNKDVLTNASDFGKRILGSYKYLTPSYWLHAPSYFQENYEYFLAQQSQGNTFNQNLYPFTEVNPYNSWFKSLRIKLLGESQIEMMERLQNRDSLIAEMFRATAKGKGIATSPSESYLQPLSGFTTPRWPSGTVTPTNVGNVGLNLTSSGTLPQFIEGSSGVARKLATLPSTPTTLSHILPPENLGGGGSKDWLMTNSPSVKGGLLAEWSQRFTSNFEEGSEIESRLRSIITRRVEEFEETVETLTDDNPFSLLGVQDM